VTIYLYIKLTAVRAYFHYGCALRCVALLQSASTRFIALAIADYRSPHNATQRNAQP